eukprot:1158008-Pelagomonas_calceolata.AAC.15
MLQKTLLIPDSPSVVEGPCSAFSPMQGKVSGLQGQSNYCIGHEMQTHGHKGMSGGGKEGKQKHKRMEEVLRKK